MNFTLCQFTFFSHFHLYFYTGSVLVEVSPPTLKKKKILWLLNISLNKVISKNLILNKTIVILNTSSGLKTDAWSIFFYAIVYFYVFIESERQRSCFISLVCVQCQVDQRSWVYRITLKLHGLWRSSSPIHYHPTLSTASLCKNTSRERMP